MAELLALKAQLEGKSADVPIPQEPVQAPVDEEANHADS